MSGQDSPDKMNLDPIYVVREERVQTHGTVKEALECSGRTIYEINSHELSFIKSTKGRNRITTRIPLVKKRFFQPLSFGSALTPISPPWIRR